MKMKTIAKVVYIVDGVRHSKTITVPVRDLMNVRPWLKAHYPNALFDWEECVIYQK